MPDALVLDVPMETGLPLMSAVGTYSMDAERKLLNHVINEVDRTLLVVLRIDLQSSDPCGIIDRRVLIATQLVTGLGNQGQELDIDLDMVSGNLLGVAARVKGATTDLPR